MEILSSRLDLGTTHSSQTAVAFSQAITKPAPAPLPVSAAVVQLSEQGKAAAATDATEADSEAGIDPHLRFVIDLLERMFGTRIKLSDVRQMKADEAGATLAQTATGFHAHLSISHTDSLSFHAQGTVQTGDGRSITLDLSFALQTTHSESLDINIGQQRTKDPLVLNLSGKSVRLSDRTYAFDLDANGGKLAISFPVDGGFLARDTHHNGQIVDGSQLFGPTNGDGFSQLQKLDADGNGWIDQNDPAYAELGLYSKDGQGQDHFETLQQAGIGALYLGNSNTDYQLHGSQQQTQGKLVSSGLWLGENGQAGSLQQVDLQV